MDLPPLPNPARLPGEGVEVSELAPISGAVKPKPRYFPPQKVWKASVISKAIYVLTPLILWPIVCWIAVVALFIAGGTVVFLAVAGDEEGALALAEPLLPYAHHGVYLGLLIGGIKAFKRLFVSREELWSLQYSSRRRRR